LLITLLLGLLNQTQFASHITKRVVDNFGRDDDFTARGPIVVAISQAPIVTHNPAPSIDLADWLAIPPPASFVLLSDNPSEICVMGIVLDSVNGKRPAISWMRVSWDSPVTLSLPDNALGAFFGIVDPVRRSLTLRRVDSFSPVRGHSVLALRSATQRPYGGPGWAF
jgi:hypothetical protein